MQNAISCKTIKYDMPMHAPHRQVTVNAQQHPSIVKKEAKAM
jgi:hypothetical protein